MSAFSLAMPQSDPRLPLSAPDPQPQRFIDKYRPSRLADVVGQGAVVFELAEFVANPYPSAWFLSGPTGTGKSSVARCVAAEIGAVEFGGLYTINSGTQDADCVLETLKDCTRAPMMVRGASGWRCIIVEECDHISPKAKQIWLSGLDDLPPKTVVIFTTNYPEKLDERFLTRGKHLQFESRADVIMQDVQTLCDHIADREGIPRVDCRNLPNIADKSGAISFRRVADAMQSATLKHRVMARLDSSPLATSPSPAPFVPPPVVPPPVIPAEVSPPVETSPVAEVAAPRRKRTGTGKRRMSALETAESALAAGNPSAESGPIRAIQEIANPDHVWIRAEGSGKRTWRLHTPSPAGFIPTDRTMDASDAIACVLAHASHKPIPVPALNDSAEVATIPPVRIQASRADRRKRINALGAKLESRMQAIHERIKEYNGLVRSHVRAHLSVVHTSGGPEAIGTIHRARIALGKLRPIRERLLSDFNTFNGRLGKIGWNTWNGGERPSAIPVLMIPDWYVDPSDVPPPVAEVAEVAAPSVETPADVPVLSATDDVRGIPNPHVAIVSVNARGETYGNYRCDGTVWERIPTFPGETCPRIAHDAMGYYLRRGDAVPVASWRIGELPAPTARAVEIAAAPSPQVIIPAEPKPRIDPAPLPLADRTIRAVSLGSADRIRIRSGFAWVLHTSNEDGIWIRHRDDWVRASEINIGLRNGSMQPFAIPDRIGYQVASPPPVQPPAIDPARLATWSIAMCPGEFACVSHASSEFRDSAPTVAPSVSPVRPIAPPPASGFSGLHVGIRGVLYAVTILVDAIRLESPQGNVYDVSPCDDLAESNHGYRCDCPNHRERHRGLPTKGCKHIQALRDCGLIPPIPTPTTPPADPGPESTPTPDRDFPMEHATSGFPDCLIRESVDMSGNRIFSAWKRDQGGESFTTHYTDDRGQRWAEIGSQLMPKGAVDCMSHLPDLEQLAIAKEWRRHLHETCYASIERVRPDAIGGRRDYGRIILPPVASGPPRGPGGIFEGIDRYPYWEVRETPELGGERRLDAWTIGADGDQFGIGDPSGKDGAKLGLFRTLNFTPEQRQRIQHAEPSMRPRIEGEMVTAQWERCYRVIEAYRPEARYGRRDSGRIYLAAAGSDSPTVQPSGQVERQGNRARVTINRDSQTIRIAFADRPAKEVRWELRNAGWKWNAEGQYWAHGYTQAAEDFAARYL